MGKQQRCQMPDARRPGCREVRAATTPSAIAPFETTESGRELGQAEPLMAPWWELADRTKQKAMVFCYCALCTQTPTVREFCCATAQRRRLAMHLRGAVVALGDGHVSRLILQHCADRRSQQQHRMCLGQDAGPCSAAAAARQSLALLRTPSSLLGCWPAPALDVQL